jgi:hypothetical protein
MEADVKEKLCEYFNIEKLPVGDNPTELVNCSDKRMKQSVILEMNLL